MHEIRQAEAMQTVGNDTVTAPLHFGQKMCLSIIIFNGFDSNIIQQCGGFPFFLVVPSSGIEATVVPFAGEDVSVVRFSVAVSPVSGESDTESMFGSSILGTLGLKLTFTLFPLVLNNRLPDEIDELASWDHPSSDPRRFLSLSAEGFQRLLLLSCTLMVAFCVSCLSLLSCCCESWFVSGF